MLRKMLRNNKGQGVVEYGVIIAGVVLVSAAAISLVGHKTADLIGVVAAILPGAHEDNGPLVSGKLIETTARADDNGIVIDTNAIVAASGQPRLGNNLLGDEASGGFGGLVLEAGHEEHDD